MATKFDQDVACKKGFAVLYVAFFVGLLFGLPETFANPTSQTISPAVEPTPTGLEHLKNEFVISESGGGLSGSFYSGAATANLSLNGEYHRAITPMFQLGALVGYKRTETRFEDGSGDYVLVRDTVSTGFEIGALASLNFGDKIPRSYFVRGSLSSFTSVYGQDGFYRTATGQLRFGKRFELVPQVSFAPYIYTQATSNVEPRTSYSYEYGLQLISASVHW